MCGRVTPDSHFNHGVAMRHVVKLYCLPQMEEERLRLLHRTIVNALSLIQKLGIKSENDLLTLFVPDMMQYGLGTEILAEVDVSDDPQLGQITCENIARSVGIVLTHEFPDATIECRVYRFKAENGFYTTKPTERVEPRGINFGDTLRRK